MKSLIVSRLLTIFPAMLLPPHPTCAAIDRSAFLHNLACVRSYCGREVRIMAVVKANAYGHGAVELSRAAASAGVEALAVARVGEALELRQSGIDLPLLTFELAPEEHLAVALAEGIELTVGTAVGGEAVSRAALRADRTARIHVKVDTGMGRLGFAVSRAAAEIDTLLRLPRLELAGVYSHFATSESPDKSFAQTQLESFLRVIDELRRRTINVPLRHMANSGAIMTMPEAHLDLVRPGIMLYGYAPAPEMTQRFAVRPVLSLLSSIIQLKTVESGTSISYGRRYVTNRRAVIATVPLGYADGFPRSLTGHASALINGKRYPVVGTICMDHLMLDLGERTDCRVGDLVTLIGSDGTEHITAWDLATAMGTIPYEITSMISSRVPRIAAT
ncbi:MAG: alanine racemase [Bacteroidota bacterium]